MQSKNDYSFFIMHNNGILTFAAVYVDDIVLTGDDTSTIHALKSHQDRVFNIKDLGRLTFFLSIGYLPHDITMN